MRKIPLLGLPLSLFLVAALIVVVAALPMVALAQFDKQTSVACWGTVTIDSVAAQDGTVVKIYIGDDTAYSAITSVDTDGGKYPPGTYTAVSVTAGESRYGTPLKYEVNGVEAQKNGPDLGVFGLKNQIVDLLVVSGDQYTLTVTVSPTGAGTVNKVPAGGYIEDTEVTLTAVANSGYTFISWSGVDSSDGNTATITMDSDKAVTASFEVADPDAITITLDPGWNVISTPMWLDEDSDRTDEILSGYDLAYRWTGTKFSKLSKNYKWEPLQAFYVKVTGSETATFAPSQEMMAPNDRKLSSNKWALIGPSPIDGTAALTVDEVLAGLNGNWANVIIPGGGYCTSANDCTLPLPAFGGAWVFVGAEKSRTIVGLYGDMTP